MNIHNVTFPILSKDKDDFQKQILPLLELQMSNHRDFILPDQAAENGFVTLLTPPSFLRKQGVSCFTAVDQHLFLGYIIGVTGDAVYENKILHELTGELMKVKHFKETSWAEKMVIAQICVDSNHRKLGISRKLYGKLQIHAHEMGIKDLFTEIDASNTGSLALHEKMGFGILDEYISPSSGQIFTMVHKDISDPLN